MVETGAAASWRRLVEARQAEAEAIGAGQRGYWNRRAAAFKRSFADRGDDPFLEFLEPWLAPSRTLIDAGAGFGRHAVPLASRLEWVTAVEPNEGMLALLEAPPNMTVIASSWEDAEAVPADLVICSHVLYGVAEPVPFVQKLERAARERVFVVMREGQPALPAEEAWAELAGRRTRMPDFADLVAVLGEMGVEAETDGWSHPASRRYETLDEALEEVAAALGERWDAARGRAWLERRLRPDVDGSIVYDAGQVNVGVAHWKPRPS